MKDGEASRSAENNAFARAAESVEEPEKRICFDPYAKYFLPPRLSGIFAVPFFRFRILSQWELFFPGVVNAILARTRFIDDYLEKCLELGLEQLIILGAGFDTRAYRFQKAMEGATVFEVDHPNTQRTKLKIVRRLFGSAPDHVRFVSIDFEKSSLEERLLKSAYSRSMKTMFVWEGVTYYLPSRAVDATLSFVKRHSPSGSLLIFDYFPPSAADGTCDLPEAKNLKKSLEKFGEKIVFGIDPEKLDSFLSNRGFSLGKNLRGEDLKRKYFRGVNRKRKVSGLFHIAVARTSSGTVRRFSSTDHFKNSILDTNPSNPSSGICSQGPLGTNRTTA